MADLEQRVIAGQEFDIGQFTDSTSGTIAALSSAGKSDIRLTAASTLQGVANGFPGKVLYIFNASASPITIANENGSATAANRILTGTGANFILAIDSGMVIVYDGTSTRWRAAGSGTIGAQGVQGSQGAQGFQGSQGTPGAQGNQGFQGLQGTPGAQGNQGFQGTAGASQTSSTYTPTYTNVTNCSSLTAAVVQYTRSGNVVILSGSVDIATTSGSAAAPTSSEFSMTVPIASSFANIRQGGGIIASGDALSGVGNGFSGEVGRMFPDNGTGKIDVGFYAQGTATRTFTFIFMYQVV